MIVAFMMAVLGVVERGVALPTGDLCESCEENELPTYNFPYMSRGEWGARQSAQDVLPLNYTVPYVVIHHSYIPPACYDNEKCVHAMKAIQDMHIDKNKWWDIGYHFAVGSNGVAYEGRGWGKLGAHALYFNNVSVGICLIGDWTQSLPTSKQIKTAKALIHAGIQLGYIKPDYKLVGHRQVRDTQCPGDALYGEIQSWPHYAPFPRSHKDLLDVEELSEDVKELIRQSSEKQ